MLVSDDGVDHQLIAGSPDASGGHATAVLVQVEHPSGFTGNAVVIVASQPEIAPLTYQVVDRSLMVQSLGFNLLSERS